MQVVEEIALQDVAYLFDGTLEGLLTCIFSAYERHEKPLDIVGENEYEPRLGQSSVFIPTDCAKAERVHRGIVKAEGREAFKHIVKASTCDDYDTGAIVYRFVRLAMSRPSEAGRARMLDDLSNPVVNDLRRLSRHASNEAERLRQFVRFSHLKNGVWFSRVKPNASVVPLVMGYFAGRLNDQPFIIYDEQHHMAGVYDGKAWQLVDGDVVSVPESTDHDQIMQEAWKRFYDALAVDARYNPELRRHFMPVRLWSNLTEMSPRQFDLKQSVINATNMSLIDYNFNRV